MYHNELSDRDTEDLIAGTTIDGAPPGLVELINELRDTPFTTTPVEPNPKLAEFMQVPDLTFPFPSHSHGHAVDGDRYEERTTVKKLVAGASAVIATTGGKLLIATAAAATTFGGMHAAQVIELPVPSDDTESVPITEVTSTTSTVPDPVTSQPETQMTDPVVAPTNENHGQEVSNLATETDLEGCERGQAIAELASTAASTHRQNTNANQPTCPSTTHGNTRQHTGAPEEIGPPEGVGGPPEEIGPPEGVGGAPEEIGPPEGVGGAPEEIGPPEGAGRRRPTNAGEPDSTR